jgi:hypothetical protein
VVGWSVAVKDRPLGAP